MLEHEENRTKKERGKTHTHTHTSHNWRRIATIAFHRSEMTEWLNANGTDMKPIGNMWLSLGMRWTNSNTSVPPPLLRSLRPYPSFAIRSLSRKRQAHSHDDSFESADLVLYFPKDNWKLNENKRRVTGCGSPANSTENDKHIQQPIKRCCSPRPFRHYLYKLCLNSLVSDCVIGHVFAANLIWLMKLMLFPQMQHFIRLSLSLIIIYDIYERMPWFCDACTHSLSIFIGHCSILIRADVFRQTPI